MSNNKEKKGNKKKLIITVVVIAVAAFLAHRLGLAEHISMNNLNRLQAWIQGFGAIAPIVYILLWIAACVFFLPGLPIAILGGVAFNPIPAIIYASVGSTLGATAAFLIGRYAARGMVEGWIEGNEQVKKIDEGVKKNGWRMLMLTRMVPVFPFNLQNYVYGLTDIKVLTYALVSWICMLPGTIAYIMASSALARGEGNLGTTFMYLGIAALFFVILSLIPKFLAKKHGNMVEEIN